MTDLQKRSLLKIAALTAVASAALVGCGKKEEPAPAPAPAAAAAATASVHVQHPCGPPPVAVQLPAGVVLDNGCYQLFTASELETYDNAICLQVTCNADATRIAHMPAQTFTLTSSYREPQTRSVDASWCRV